VKDNPVSTFGFVYIVCEDSNNKKPKREREFGRKKEINRER